MKKTMIVGLILTAIWVSSLFSALLYVYPPCRGNIHDKVDDRLEAEMCKKAILDCNIMFRRKYTAGHKAIIERLGGKVYGSAFSVYCFAYLPSRNLYTLADHNSVRYIYSVPEVIYWLVM